MRVHWWWVGEAPEPQETQETQAFAPERPQSLRRAPTGPLGPMASLGLECSSREAPGWWDSLADPYPYCHSVVLNSTSGRAALIWGHQLRPHM